MSKTVFEHEKQKNIPISDIKLTIEILEKRLSAGVLKDPKHQLPSLMREHQLTVNNSYDR